MHQPLLDRARANAGGSGYDFAPFFTSDRAVRRQGRRRPLPCRDADGPGPDHDLSDLQHADRPREVDPPQRLGRVRHRLQPLARRRPGRASTAPSRRSTSAGVKHTGSFSSKKRSSEPTILNVDGVKIGYVAYTDATNGFTPPHPWSLNTYPAADPKAGAKAIIHDARKARDAGADAVIAQLHWGDENSQRPNASQVAVAKKLTGAKVITVVVGQGPHVVQPIERINGKFVVFSEGNLVSNQSAVGRAAHRDPGRADRAAALQGRRRQGHGPPGHLRPDLGPPGRLRRAAGEAIAGSSTLHASYRRTVKVVGKGDGFGPAF